MAQLLLLKRPMRTPIDCRATGDERTALSQPAARYGTGTLLSGKYRLETLLGEGGMGSVWLATNTLLDLPVALKLIRADLDRGALRARLQLEARSAAKLGHPAIVRVFDVGESEFGDPFIVMEHLRGETLGQLLSHGRLPATRAVQLLLPIIDALAVAHGRGIVHRDLKPDNVMLALEEQQIRPKILDFGIAKLTDPRDSEHKLTEIGAVIGSPEYMSPEQARGQDDIDAGTDIWSMCVVIYEALTGNPPFTASNYNALLRCIVEDDPKPLSESTPGTNELWAILQRGLHKQRAQRYAKISELGRALAVWLLDQGVTEDACGSSLDSKWIGRASDPLSTQESAALRSPSQQSRARLPYDSTPDSTEPARGSFSATIRAVEVRRPLGTRAAYALLGVSLLVLGLSALVAAPKAPAAGLPVSSVASVTAPAAEPIPAPALEPAVRLEPTVVPAKTAPETTPLSSASPETVAKPAGVSAPPRRAAIAWRATAPGTRPAAPSAPAAATRHELPLDLLAPY